MGDCVGVATCERVTVDVRACVRVIDVEGDGVGEPDRVTLAEAVRVAVGERVVDGVPVPEGDPVIDVVASTRARAASLTTSDCTEHGVVVPPVAPAIVTQKPRGTAWKASSAKMYTVTFKLGERIPELPPSPAGPLPQRPTGG